MANFTLDDNNQVNGIIIHRDEKGCIFPTTCPLCGGRLEVSYPVFGYKSYRLDASGRRDALVDEDSNPDWSEPRLYCSGQECGFEWDFDSGQITEVPQS